MGVPPPSSPGLEHPASPDARLCDPDSKMSSNRTGTAGFRWQKWLVQRMDDTKRGDLWEEGAFGSSNNRPPRQRRCSVGWRNPTPTPLIRDARLRSEACFR